MRPSWRLSHKLQQHHTENIKMFDPEIGCPGYPDEVRAGSLKFTEPNPVYHSTQIEALTVPHYLHSRMAAVHSDLL